MNPGVRIAKLSTRHRTFQAVQDIRYGLVLASNSKRAEHDISLTKEDAAISHVTARLGAGIQVLHRIYE
jgi:hypothetical protein